MLRNENLVTEREREGGYRVAISLREDMEASRTEGDSSARAETSTCMASAISITGSANQKTETRKQRTHGNLNDDRHEKLPDAGTEFPELEAAMERGTAESGEQEIEKRGGEIAEVKDR